MVNNPFFFLLFADFHPYLTRNEFSGQDCAAAQSCNFVPCKAHLYFILAYVSEKMELRSKSKTNYSLMEETIAYIQAHLSSNLTLGEVATAMGYEYHHFSRFFSQHFSCGFSFFVNQLRLYRATELLREKDLSIQDIADLCHYQNIRTFNRNFAATFHMSPSQYRSSYRITKDLPTPVPFKTALDKPD